MNFRPVAVVLILLACDGGWSRAFAEREQHALLDVPYLTQTPELCGGAAVSMVLRYWGERAVLPQDFASLVDASRGGIFTGALTSAINARGWQAVALPSVAEAEARGRMRAELDRGRPLIALVEVAPRTYHYIVLVGSTDKVVVVHDPARAPFQVLSWDAFDRAWDATDRWALLVLPPSTADTSREPALPSDTASATTSAGSTSACSALVNRSVSLAVAGEPNEAEQGLMAAARLCPRDVAPLRELAGLRFTQSRWLEAADLAGAAVVLAPEDVYAWQLLATSRYLGGDLPGSLDAWNRAGEPRVDVVQVEGSPRMWRPLIVRTTGLQPRQLLTPAAFGRAERRLGELPTAERVRLRFDPLPDGLARVDVAVTERPLLPSGWPALASIAARALVLDEVNVDFGGALSSGERESAMWRWKSGRPRVSLGVSRPSPFALPGILSLVGTWERESYAPLSVPQAASPSSTDDAAREERQRLAVSLADWATRWLRWQSTVAFDRWREPSPQGEGLSDRRSYVAMEEKLDVRMAGDHAALVGTAGWWSPMTAGPGFGSTSVLAAWRSTVDETHPSWSAVSAFDQTTGHAPLSLWPGAGSGQGRTGLLRAHPLLSGAVLDGPVFGRQVARGSLERTWPLAQVLGNGVSLAAFVDTAKAWQRRDEVEPSRLYVDAGVGVRVRSTGLGGAVRLDLAQGLRGGGTRVSAGWGAAWPR